MFSLLLCGSLTNSFAQQYRSPLDIPLVLSANCGELRNNHFHSGIDIKTQAVTGKTIHSVADGYVSRISVSPSGYGLALYITHPATGHTSVYGHLLRYNSEIQAYLKDQQYKQESFSVDLKLNPKQIPVKRGDIVAYSGNTGGSGGPHLHFEIRDSKTERVLDPLVYYKNQIDDNRSPEIRGIAAYPVPGRGVINGSSEPLRQSVSMLKSGTYSNLRETIEAWGVIGLGIKAYDRMTGTSNVYGVKKMNLSVDGKEIFKYETNAFSFDETRMINTFTDFADWRLNNSFFMQSFIEPGNTLPFYSAKDRGYIDIKEERPYRISYHLEDVYGNETSYNFTIVGRKQTIETPSGCSLVMVWNDNNHYISDLLSLVVPKGNLYNDVCFTLSQTPSSDYYSNIFTINNKPVPLHKYGEVKVKLKYDPLNNKKQYGLVQIKGNKPLWIGGTYSGGAITAPIRELGIRVAVSDDTESPVVSLYQNTKTIKKGKKKVIVKQSNPNKIELRVTDNLSGVASYRGTIDGKFALFEHDMKSPLYIYNIDGDRIGTGKTHELVFVATDQCGNSTEYTYTFEY